MSNFTRERVNASAEPLPSHLNEADVRAAADDAGTLLDCQQLLRLNRTRTRRLLKERGLLQEVQRAGPETMAELREGGDDD